MERAPASLWRKLNSSYNLVGSKCEKCGALHFPPRIICRNCGRGSKIAPFKFSGDGEVYSFTKIHAPSEMFREEGQYTIAVVKTVEGPMVEGHVIDNGKEIDIGAKVRTVFRKMYTEGEEGLIHYHYKFELV